MSQDFVDRDMDATAQMIADLTRRRVAHRRDRVVMLARVTRQALDDLPPDQRGPGFVARTWKLPDLTSSIRREMDSVVSAIERFLSFASARAVLLARATRLVIDDLSPDEKIDALSQASQIIGTPP